jgi:hypothetical protein
MSSSPLTREQIVKHLTYSVTGNVLRLSEGTSRSAGYLELVDPEATPLVPAFAIALRREIFLDAEILAHQLNKAVEIHASDPARSWLVGRISPSASMRVAATHEAATQEVESSTGYGDSPPAEGR